MSMSNNGLTKLLEELGELAQVAAKLIAYPEGPHPDGGPPLLERLAQEMADVSASCAFVAQKHELDMYGIGQRSLNKLNLYRLWDQEGAPTAAPVVTLDKEELLEYLDRVGSYAYTMPTEAVVLGVKYIPDIIERFLRK